MYAQKENLNGPNSPTAAEHGNDNSNLGLSFRVYGYTFKVLDGHAKLPILLSILGNSLYRRYEQSRNITDISEAILLLRQAVQLSPVGHVNLPSRLNKLATSLADCFESTGDLGHLSEAISSSRRAVQLTPSNHADLPPRLNNLGTFLLRHFDYTGGLSEISEAISSLQHSVQLSPNDHVDLPSRMSNLGISLEKRFTHTRNPLDISGAISSLHRSLQLTLDENDLPPRLNNLGSSLLSRFDHTGDLDDISEAILSLRRAIHLTPNDHADLPTFLDNLGGSLVRKFERMGSSSDIAEAIPLFRRAVQLSPKGHPDAYFRLNNFGNALVRRFEHTGDASVILEAISTHRHAVQLTPKGHANLPIILTSLGCSLLLHFQSAGDSADITEAISSFRCAVQLTPSGHGDLSSRLNNLGESLRSRFKRTGNLSDISEAISSQRHAVQLAPNDLVHLPSFLNSLGESLRSRFKRTGDLIEISEAITSQRHAVQLTPNDHSHLPSRLSNLGNSLESRFDLTGDLSDLLAAVSAHRRAVQITPNGHIDLPFRLNDLGNTLQAYFTRNGGLGDISEAILSQQRAVQLTPKDHVNLPAMLSCFGHSLARRFQHNGDLSDISKAITSLRHALQLTPNGHSETPSRLISLGNVLLIRFMRTQEPSDISEAISSHRRGVQLTPDGHAHLSSRLSQLGNSLARRFELTEDLTDISEAISSHRLAVKLSPSLSDHADLPAWLTNLGLALQSRCKYTKDPSDIPEALLSQQRALELTPEGHPNLTSVLSNLGTTFLLSYLLSQDRGDAAVATSLCRQASNLKLGSPSEQLHSARQWVICCKIYDPAQLLDAYAVVIALHSEVAGMQQTIEIRHENLMQVSHLSSAAAAAAISLARYDIAVEWLEQSRCLVWTQLTQLRTPLDDLHNKHPDLADQLRQVSQKLESAGSRQRPLNLEDDTVKSVSFEEEAHTHIKLVQQRDQLLKKIRSTPDSEFHNFLQPRKIPNLFSHLPAGDRVLVINIHEDRCDAIALIDGRDTPLHIPLERFSFKRAEELHMQLSRYLASKGRAIVRNVPTGKPKESGIHQILQVLWLDVVKPILDEIGCIRPTSTPSCIWWCVTGPLAFLPIHAAGIYRTGGSCLLDFAVSSYIPTVSMLIDKITDNTERRSSRLLLVSQAKAPGLPYISNTETETSLLSILLPKAGVDVLRLNSEAATTVNVKKEMGSYNSIHIACHGIQDVENRWKSGFCLYDRRLELSEIIKQQIPQADLAFLSACQTSTGDKKLADEAVHLAAGMLAAGYRHVVSTMWSIEDQYGPEIAEEFYKHLLEIGNAKAEPCLDGAKAVYALHHTTQCLRRKLGDTEESLLAWVPYVHFGL